MTGTGGRRSSALKYQAIAVLGSVMLAACGGGTTKAESGEPPAGAPAQGSTRSGGRGSVAFAFTDDCTRAVSDGKGFLAIGCNGRVSRLDPATGNPRWSVTDPTWTGIDSIRLGGEVVVAAIKVTIPASGLNAKQEGSQVVALADGKKVWATDLFQSPASSPKFATSSEVTIVAQGGNNTSPALDATVAAFDTKSGRQRFRKVVDKTKCGLFTQPLILRDSVAVCSQRFTLTDGSGLPFQNPRKLANPGDDLVADASSDLFAAWGPDNAGDNGFGIFHSDGRQLGKAKGEFLGFVGGTVVQRDSDSKGRVGSVSALNPDGSVRWEQPVTLSDRGFFNDVSFANGAAWVRNTSSELIAIDGATGKAATPLPVSTVGLGVTAKVVATTADVVIVSTGSEGGSPSLTAVAL